MSPTWIALRYLAMTPFVLALLVGGVVGLASLGRARVPAFLVLGACGALLLDFVVLNLVWELGADALYQAFGNSGIAGLVVVGRGVPTLSMIALALAAVWGRSRGEPS